MQSTNRTDNSATMLRNRSRWPNVSGCGLLQFGRESERVAVEFGADRRKVLLLYKHASVSGAGNAR